MEGSGALAVRLHPHRRNGLHVGRRVPSCTACLAPPSHHQDASFTTSAALYGRTVASHCRHIPVRQAVRMTTIDLLKVPDAQRCSHDPATHRPRARSSRVQHVARRVPRETRPCQTVGQNPPPTSSRQSRHDLRRVPPGRPSRSRRAPEERPGRPRRWRAWQAWTLSGAFPSRSARTAPSKTPLRRSVRTTSSSPTASPNVAACNTPPAACDEKRDVPDGRTSMLPSASGRPRTTCGGTSGDSIDSHKSRLSSCPRGASVPPPKPGTSES